MQGVIAALMAGAERAEPVIRRHLPRVIAGLVVVGLAAANVPQTAEATAAARSEATLVRSITAASTFLGDPAPGRDGAESTARALTASLGGLPVEPERGLGPWVRSGGALVPVDRCPPADLVVSWRPPSGDHRIGAYVEPLGPAPNETTTRVNGLVRCRTSPYAILGFEALYEGGRWRLAAVPSLADESDEPLLAGEAEATGATPAETLVGEIPALPPASAWAGAPLEALTPHVPQTTCDPVAKPGALGFRDLLLATFPHTRNLGIGRACEATGVSEHKEGRAFDWGVRVDDPAERAAADEMLAWLLGPEADTGEPFAIARRLGVMYVIWNGQIWSAFRAVDGWRPYVGVSGHREHIHVSFDWPGALGDTSFWRGGRAAVRAGSEWPDLPLIVVPTSPPATMPPPFGLPPGAVLPPIPLPPGLTVPPPNSGPIAGGGDDVEPPSPSPTTTATSTTQPPTTTTSPPPSTTTTTTTAPPPTFVPAPPTTVQLGGL